MIDLVRNDKCSQATFHKCAIVSENSLFAEQSVIVFYLQPARELAQQTYDNITLFKKHIPAPGVRYASCFMLA